MYRSYGNCNIVSIPPPLDCDINIQCEEREYSSVFSPSVWGESLWFLFHVGSLVADSKISPIDSVKYWNFIEGIPLMLPCKMCSEHAQKFIDNERPNRENVVSSRDNLIDFFVKFHNQVNTAQGKPAINRSDIERLANGRVKVNTIRYY